MLNRLRQKWNISRPQLLAILLIFALGGSFTGYLGRQLVSLFDIEIFFLYIVVYILLVTAFWPFAVLLLSIPFGQFPFFKKYISRIGKKLFNRNKT